MQNTITDQSTASNVKRLPELINSEHKYGTKKVFWCVCFWGSRWWTILMISTPLPISCPAIPKLFFILNCERRKQKRIHDWILFWITWYCCPLHVACALWLWLCLCTVTGLKPLNLCIIPTGESTELQSTHPWRGTYGSGDLPTSTHCTMG